jgi:hypothetical protein
MPRHTLLSQKWYYASSFVPKETVMQKLKDLAISDTGFVFDPYSGATFSANPTALCLLEGLKQGLSREDVVRRVHLAFDVLGDDVSHDLDELVQTLRAQNLVSADFEVA